MIYTNHYSGNVMARHSVVRFHDCIYTALCLLRLLSIVEAQPPNDRHWQTNVTFHTRLLKNMFTRRSSIYMFCEKKIVAFT